MRFVFLFLLFLHSAFAVDFDCIIVGTSPFSLFEALYRCHSGQRVLILEQDSVCGGAWKSVDICGVAHADLGCHQIGHDWQLKSFLEEYAGCRIVSMDRPFEPFDSVSTSPTGFYFSQGCYELIDHLLKLIAATDIVLLLNHEVESAFIDVSGKQAIVKTKDRSFTASKLVATSMSSFSIENSPPRKNNAKSKYYHLYLLIDDPTPPRFTYHNGGAAGVSRIMNLTHFVGLADTGRQLLVFQTHGEQHLAQGQTFLDALKKKHLAGESAYILKEESLLYETSHFNQRAEEGDVLEMLQTGHFQNLSTHLSKWKTVLKPYAEVLR